MFILIIIVVSHGKLNLNNLTVLVPGKRNEWFQTPVNASGLALSLGLGTTSSVTGSFVPCQRDDMRRSTTFIYPLRK
jgi:hypothetical protein